MNITLITGASGGIGAAFAKRLAAEKHNLLLVARSEDKLKTLCETLKAKHHIETQYIVADLSKPGTDKTIFDETKKRGLNVNWLINNAGIGSAGDFLEITLDSELAMLDLNLKALVALTHRYLPDMRTVKSGTIINVGSVAGFQPIPYMATYAASKAFVRSFTEAIAEENRPFHIHVMLLCPGATETSFFDAAKIEGETKGIFSGGGKLETPEQVVDAAMRGLKKGNTVTTSGFTNKLMAIAGNFVSNRIITRGFAKMVRSKLKK